ncbi:MAG TPA: FAD-dependent oxidoreductase [Kofleriaceae bacterium]|nr:FAD-dependent oxidoreductase [Kofleriaceae bacterium]
MGISRREFTAMLLGAPLAYACARRGPARIPPGALVETGMRRGHAAVRDARAVPAVPRWRRVKVAIVGGGVAGLSAAWELRRRGVTDVVIVELDDVFGGTARGGESSVTPYPWGAHYIVAPQRDDDLAALLAEMGAIEGHAADGSPIVDEALRCREPEERVWWQGRWWEGLYLDAGASPDDRRQLAAFRAEIDRWAGWRDEQGRRAFAIPRSTASPAPELAVLDTYSFAHWLDAHGLVSPRLRWLADYACRDDYALTAAQTSAWAGIFYFAARQRAPGAAAQTVVTWPDGNASLVRELARGATIERGLAVVDIDEVTGRMIAVGDAGWIGLECDAIISCVPRFVANRVIRGRRGQSHGDYGAWTVANVHLRARPIERGRGAPPAWDNVFRDSPSLGYVCATHQRGRDRGPTVWTWYYAFADDDAAAVRRKLAGAGYDEWAEVVLADLERAHPDVREHVERIEVAFWGHGMIRPRVGAMFGADPTVPIGRVHFAHTDLSGLALFEEAFDHGLRAAREVAEALTA